MSCQKPFIQEMAYKRFKLFWMLRHGHSLNEFAKRLLEVRDEWAMTMYSMQTIS